MAAPPINSVLKLKSRPKRRPTALSTFTPSITTSGPLQSPGRRRILATKLLPRVVHQAAGLHDLQHEIRILAHFEKFAAAAVEHSTPAQIDLDLVPILHVLVDPLALHQRQADVDGVAVEDAVSYTHLTLPTIY